jgi:exonuclease SbcC
MIKSIRLRNWKCHLDSYLEFTEGTNALLGVMGAGKTSVLEAITFALFGTTPAVQQKKMRLEDLIMKKPVRKSFAEVELEFVVNNKVFKVKRRIERGKPSYAELRIDNKLVEVQSQRVTEFIEEALKVDFDLFTRAIYSEQNRIDAFLNLPKGQRMKKIDEILKLDRFENARANVVTLINRLRDERTSTYRMIQEMKRNINEDELKKLEKEIESLKEELKVIEDELLAVKGKRRELETRKRKLEEIKRSVESLEKELRKVEGEIEVLERDARAEVPEYSYLKKREEELEKELESVKRNREEVEREIKRLREERDSILRKINECESAERRIEEIKGEVEKIDKIKREINEVKREVEELKRRRELLSARFFSLKSKIEEEEKWIKELERVESYCPICKRDMSSELKERLVNERKEMLKKFKAEQFSVSKEFSVVERKIEERESFLKELEKRYYALLSLKSEIEALEEKAKEREKYERDRESVEKLIKEKEVEREKIYEKEKELVRELESVRHIISKVAEVIRKRRELEEKRKRREVISAKLRELRSIFSERELEEISKELESVLKAESSMEARKVSIEEIIREKVARKERIERDIEVLKGLEKDYKRLEFLIVELEKFRIALVKTQEELRKVFIAAINTAMDEIWKELYPYGDFQSIRLHVEEGDYVLQLQELSGAWINAEHVSGGERTLAALTLRIAFALVLAPQVGWLILDEPTHNLDVRAREELARVLRDRIGEFIPQVFLITHDSLMEDAVSGVLYKIEREKEKDGVAKIIKME